MNAQDGFGTPAEWGLTPARHREICTELADHLQCTEEREGAAPAEKIAGSLAQPKTRRRLAAAHLADQVYATLHRKPTREEWRELAWLGLWFVLIVASDVYAAQVIRNSGLTGWEVPLAWRAAAADAPPLPLQFTLPLFIAWALGGVSRAGFFASFSSSLYRAWSTGWGVCLARVIQLKLIHTLLVVTGMLLIERFAAFRWLPQDSLESLASTLPLWLNALAVCGTLMLIGAGVWLLRPKFWPAALFTLLAAGFLYAGGPPVSHAFRASSKIADNQYLLSDGRTVAAYDQKVGDELLGAKVLAVLPPDPYEVIGVLNGLSAPVHFSWSELSNRIVAIDEPANRFTFVHYVPLPLPFHLPGYQGTWPYAKRSGWHPLGSQHPDAVEDLTAPAFLNTPQFSPRGGLGWLAAPIPLLSLICVAGLVLLLGRRGATTFGLYLLLAILCLGTTLIPFFAAAGIVETVDFSPHMMLSSPFPYFESLIQPNMSGALLLSAAIPWLMTGLFLKPRSTGELPAFPDDLEKGAA